MKHSILNSSILMAIPFMLAADKGGGSGGTATAAPKAAASGTGTGTAPNTGTTESPQPTPQAKPGAPQPKVHEKLLTAISGYDQHVAEAESYYIQMIELVLTEKISRADVVATLMRARSITFETAQSQYSRMKGIWSNPDILAKLKSGEITLKIAREMTTKKQAGAGTDANAAGGDKPGSKTSTETKEARYERARKAHVAAVKENGFDKKSAMLSFDADLSAAGVK